jgi:hypothetical protein
MADVSVHHGPPKAQRSAAAYLQRTLDEVNLEVSGESVDAVQAELVRRLDPVGIHPELGVLRSYAEEISAGAFNQSRCGVVELRHGRLMRS